jgi:uncharacterized spore protein YtfJ
MDVPKILKTIGEQMSTFASGKLAFAEPVSVADRTVIPVAWVRYDFGAGGSTPAAFSRMADKAGGGGGGQVSVIPAGVIEITPTGTRFIPVPDGKKIFALIASSSASSGMNDGGAPEKQNNFLGAAKTPTKKTAAAYRAANKKAAGKRSLLTAKKAPAKKATANKAVSVKTSRSLSQKTSSAKTSLKKAASTKSAARKR